MTNFVTVGALPDIRQLQVLEGRGRRKLRIMHEVTPHWKSLAIALGFDGPGIEIINQRALRDPEEACREMFVRWLDGDNDLEPVTWDALVQCLIHAGLVDVADNLKECLVISRQAHN